ncbi:MAG: phosphate transport system regulatory protein PhoU [Rhodospirillales bacterium RIFCSPLOWO2_12_FULL_67_15]|nr:MAG: phosphate transport system regulatory protein PhoU [Rhodospirillales bacterium RIFCSPLOWO2_12_FULL_67_15]
MTTEHIVKAFDQDLRRLDTIIAEMGGLVETQFAAAIEAMLQRDVERAEQIIAADERVDELEKELDRSVIKLIALRQPMADDLRMMIAALRIGGAIERIGDYARNIAKRTLALAQAPPVAPAQTVARLGELVLEMLRNALDAYLARDAAMAYDVRRSDHDADAMYTSLFRELLTYMMEDPRNITSCTHLMFAAKNVERIGDHITTIAENVIYLVSGDVPENKRPKGDETSTVVASIPTADRR